MKKTTWILNEFGNYYSEHLLVTYLGDKTPIYHVLNNPEDNGWVIGVFYGFVGGEYVPLEEDGEERLVFQTAKEAMDYVDLELKQ